MSNQIHNLTFNSTVGGFTNGDNNTINISQNIDLNEAEKQLQQILSDLIKDEIHSDIDFETQLTQLKQKIKHNPDLKARLISAFKAGGIETLKAIANHPAVSIPVEVIKGWIEAESNIKDAD